MRHEDWGHTPAPRETTRIPGRVHADFRGTQQNESTVGIVSATAMSEATKPPYSSRKVAMTKLEIVRRGWKKRLAIYAVRQDFRGKMLRLTTKTLGVKAGSTFRCRLIVVLSMAQPRLRAMPSVP